MNTSMNMGDDQKRKQAIQGLMNIVALETMLIIAVIVVFIVTKNVTYLIAGVIGVALISGPMFWRWFRGSGQALKNPTDGTKR